jgi:uncharacterized protein YjbJ (UPF0337 family)
MPESAKDIQGKVKEKAGDATGDDQLKHEGQAEQAGEKVKGGVDDAVDKAKDVIDR